MGSYLMSSSAQLGAWCYGFIESELSGLSVASHQMLAPGLPYSHFTIPVIVFESCVHTICWTGLLQILAASISQLAPWADLPISPNTEMHGHKLRSIRKEVFGGAVKMSFARPTKMLVTEYVVCSFTQWVSFAWAILHVSTAIHQKEC